MSVLYDNVHFNEAGSRKVAQIISDHLKARAPFVALTCPLTAMPA